MEEIQAQPVPVQIVSEPAQPEASDTALKEPPAPPIPQARPSAPAQPSSETGLKKAPVAPIPKGKSVIERVTGRRAKPGAALRSKRGVRVRARGAEEEEEEYEAPGEKRKKQLIIVGVIVAVALIALLVWYFASYKPGAERAQRIQNYKETALDFTGKVRDLCASYAEKEIPVSAASFRNSVNGVKSRFEDGVKPVTEGYRQMLTLPSYKDMETVLNKLEGALRLVEERVQVDQDREQTPESRKERVDKINLDFQAVIKECNSLATRIEGAVKSLH
jgi:hypothetical protein